MRKILIVVCLHGHESFGIVVKNFFKTNAIDGVTCIIGNPIAQKRNTRYIDHDLNRSFSGNGRGYEKKRASYLLHKIQEYDFVIDVHNTYTNIKSVPIVANLSPMTKQILNLHPSRQIAYMPRKIASSALIGNHKAGVSLEYGFEYSKSPEALNEVSRIVELLVAGAKKHPKSRELFYIDRTIPSDKSTTFTGDLNYKYIKSLKGYGFLVGEKSYEGYRGFIASRVKKLVV